MAKYPFLSDEWVAQARRIYGEASANGAIDGSAAPAPVRVNLVVTGVPFADAPIDAHVDTSAGTVAVDTGHLEKPDVTVSMDYMTARSLFIAGDVQAVMQAFLSGKIRVDGDLAKLLDPRTGVWPASSALPSWGPFAQTEDAPQGAQLPLGVTVQPSAGQLARQQLAARLQEITE